MGKPGSFVFQSGEIWEVGTTGKNKSRSALVPAVYLEDDQEAPILVDSVFQRDRQLNCAPAGSAELVSSQ